VKLLEREHKIFFDAMEILKYFKMHPELILDYPTDALVKSHVEMTTKAVTRDVYEKHFKGRELSTIGASDFRERINAELSTRLEANGMWDETQIRYLAEGVNRGIAFLETCRRKHDGKMPRLTFVTDANLVSAAMALENDQDMPRYEQIRVFTMDSDIAELIILNRKYKMDNGLPVPKVRWAYKIEDLKPADKPGNGK